MDWSGPRSSTKLCGSPNALRIFELSERSWKSYAPGQGRVALLVCQSHTLGPREFGFHRVTDLRSPRVRRSPYTPNPVRAPRCLLRRSNLYRAKKSQISSLLKRFVSHVLEAEGRDDQTLREMQKILYSTEDGFEVPESEGAVDEEETF
ncbi:hypothetical protein B0H11DRAFT_2252357 [Mycena galericulata]|nr:hypothetical protein B0H11DRAFT_2252357 [Mycena galericulata]